MAPNPMFHLAIIDLRLAANRIMMESNMDGQVSYRYLPIDAVISVVVMFPVVMNHKELTIHSADVDDGGDQYD